MFVSRDTEGTFGGASKAGADRTPRPAVDRMAVCAVCRHRVTGPVVNGPVIRTRATTSVRADRLIHPAAKRGHCHWTGFAPA